MTCNPKWPEIQRCLGPKEVASDRPDISARVFKLKVDSLIHDLTVKQFWGVVLAYSYTIEWQKRGKLLTDTTILLPFTNTVFLTGLPHVHLLLFMANEDKPHTTEHVNRVVTAEMPNQHTHPELASLVEQHMVHGPCGEDGPNAPCMVGTGADRKCSKRYPKEFQEATVQLEEQYPRYRRRSPAQGGRVILTRGRRRVTNEWVVPYNPVLLHRYRCHMNVESVHCLEAVKYIFKYITKGKCLKSCC